MEFGIYSSIPASDPITDFVNSELSQKRLRFYLPENAHEFDFSEYDYVVDAVDTVLSLIHI